MTKTGRLVAGKSPDEMTGKLSTAVVGGRAVDATAKTAATYRKLPKDIAIEEK